MILGIDQSMSCTGLVVLDVLDVVHHDTIKTSKDGLSIFERFNIITDKIIDVILKYDIDKVHIEGLPMGNIKGNSSKDLAGLQSVIICKILEQCNIVCVIISPTAVKKFATDNGKASKTEMVDALPLSVLDLFKSSGYKKTTGIQDLADAYFIGKYK